jgi:DNA-binding transcriptional LysR family regulator
MLRTRLGILQAMQRPGGISIAAAIANFRGRYPGVAVEIRQGPSGAVAAAVRTGDLDLAYVTLPDSKLPGLTMTVLGQSELRLACHPSHRLADREAVELSALADEPFAELPPGWGWRVANDRAFERAGVHRKLAYEVNDIPTVLDFVRHGVAVAIIYPAWAAPGRDVTFVRLRRHARRIAISLASPATRPATRAARAFIEIATSSQPGAR